MRLPSLGPHVPPFTGLKVAVGAGRKGVEVGREPPGDGEAVSLRKCPENSGSHVGLGRTPQGRRLGGVRHRPPGPELVWRWCGAAPPPHQERRGCGPTLSEGLVTNRPGRQVPVPLGAVLSLPNSST